MRFAFADPPYLGCAESVYGDPTYDNPEAHRALIARLAEYDAWVLCLHAPSLFVIRAMCPADARVLIWAKTWVNLGPAAASGFLPYCWEPVIAHGGRRPTGNVIRDWWSGAPEMQNFKGAKPLGFCWWLFHAMGLEPDDEFDDLFVGSGAVSRAWTAWRDQYRLRLA